LAKFLDKYCAEDPNIFVEDRKSRDKLLAKFEKDISILKNYPRVLQSMFSKLNEPIPPELEE